MKYTCLLFALLCVSPLCWSQLTNSGATIVVEPGATLKLEGGAPNVNESTITLSGTMSVAGNLNNQGTITGTGTAALLHFTGTQASVFTVGNTTLSNLATAKTGADLSLIGDLRLGTSLSFTGAVGSRVVLRNNNLQLAPTATITGATGQNYVNTNGSGFLVKEITAANNAFTFPVGNTTGQTALVTDVTGTAFASSATLRVKVNPTADPNLPTELSDYLTRHWEVLADGITDYRNEVSASYLPTDVTGQESLIEGASYANGTWSFTDAARAAGSVLGTIEATDATFTGLNVAALPVELVAFTAAKAGAATARLSWITANEQNTSHFSVERSTDALHWTSLETVTASGYSQDRREYSFLDKGIPLEIRRAGTVYYRLDMVDFDGFREYSPLRSLRFPGEASALRVYPNPTADFIQISGDASIRTVRVYDESGKNVMTTAATPRLDLTRLPAGTYLLRVETENDISNTTVIKQAQ